MDLSQAIESGNSSVVRSDLVMGVLVHSLWVLHVRFFILFIYFIYLFILLFVRAVVLLVWTDSKRR